MVRTAALIVAAKLIIVQGSQPPTVIDYRSMARCEAAKIALLRQSFDPMAGKVEEIKGGGMLLHPPQQFSAYCIPG